MIVARRRRGWVLVIGRRSVKWERWCGDYAAEVWERLWDGTCGGACWQVYGDGAPHEEIRVDESNPKLRTPYLCGVEARRRAWARAKELWAGDVASGKGWIWQTEP